jgi:hypothetical protein
MKGNCRKEFCSKTKVSLSNFNSIQIPPATMSAFPPQRTIPSIPISQEIALKFLSNYLEATTSSPYLLPNARLESSGPTAGSSASSVTIHNLRRVEAGLRGEWLAPTLDLEEGNITVAEGMDDGTNKGQDVNEEGEGEGWMDLDEYQREQSIEGGEVGDRIQGVAEVGDSDFEGPQVVEEEKEKEAVDTNAHTSKKTKATHSSARASKPLDKEARKKEKKERMRQERRMREEARKLQSQE